MELSNDVNPRFLSFLGLLWQHSCNYRSFHFLFYQLLLSSSKSGGGLQDIRLRILMVRILLSR
jgi:hypothetical protein